MEAIVEFSDAESNLMPIGELDLEGAFAGIKVNGAEVASDAYVYDAEAKTITFVEGKFPYGEFVDFSVLTETHEYAMNGVFTFVTKAIANADDLNWVAANKANVLIPHADRKTGKASYFVVTNSFDYGGGDTWTKAVGVWGSSYPYLGGTFNGRGNTISNMIWKNGFIHGVGCYGVLENIAFTGITVTLQDEGGMLVNRENLGVIRNVYIEAAVVPNNPYDKSSYQHVGLYANETIAASGVVATIENVVMKVTGRSTATTADSGFMAFQLGVVNNVYVISDMDEKAVKGINSYNGVAAFLEAVDEDALIVALGANWAKAEDGTVVFKSSLPKEEPAPSDPEEEPLPEEEPVE